MTAPGSGTSRKALLAALLACSSLSAQVGALVSFHVLGPGQPSDEQKAKAGFLSSLAAHPGFAPKWADPSAAAQWDQPAEAGEAMQLSLVVVRFGERQDWIVFHVGRDGAILGAWRRPAARKTIQRRDTILPGPMQIAENAVKELSADAARALPGRMVSEGRTVRVQVASVSAADGRPGMDPAGWGGASDVEVEGIRALVYAALSAEGYRPMRAEGAATMTLAIARGVQSYKVRMVFARQDRSWEHETVLAEDVLYEHLVRMCRKVLSWRDGVSDFRLLVDGGARLVGLASRTVYVAARNEGLAAMDARSGKILWTIPPAERVSARYFMRAGDRPALFQVARALVRLDLNTGRPTTVSLRPDSEEGFEALSDVSALVVQGARLLRCEQYRIRWAFAAPASITGGPYRTGDCAMVASESGDVYAIGIEDGKPRWHKALDQRLVPPFAGVDGMFVAGSMEGRLVALDAEGNLLWQADVGDRLIATPVAMDGKMAVASADKTVRLIGIRSGLELCRKEMPAHLVDLCATGGGKGLLLACADREGTVRFLSAEDLSVAREVRLGTRLTPWLVSSPEFPRRLAAGGTLIEEGPSVLVLDERGFLYVLPVP